MAGLRLAWVPHPKTGPTRRAPGQAVPHARARIGTNRSLSLWPPGTPQARPTPAKRALRAEDAEDADVPLVAVAAPAPEASAGGAPAPGPGEDDAFFVSIAEGAVLASCGAFDFKCWGRAIKNGFNNAAISLGTSASKNPALIALGTGATAKAANQIAAGATKAANFVAAEATSGYNNVASDMTMLKNDATKIGNQIAADATKAYNTVATNLG